MKTTWFKPFGLIYLRIHFMGLIITSLAFILLIPIYAAIAYNGHSVSDDLYPMFVYITCNVFWWKWIAKKMSAHA